MTTRIEKMAGEYDDEVCKNGFGVSPYVAFIAGYKKAKEEALAATDEEIQCAGIIRVRDKIEKLGEEE